MTSFELAQLLSKMHGNVSEVARRARIKQGRASRLLIAWRYAPDEVKARWARGEVSENEAYQAARRPTSTVRDLRALLTELRRPTTPYEHGVLHALQFAARGTPPSDDRWRVYIPDHERDDPPAR